MARLESIAMLAELDGAVLVDKPANMASHDVVKVVNLLAGKDKSTKTATNAPGVSSLEETNDNYVNVEGSLKTGIQNNVKIDITGALLPSTVAQSCTASACPPT